ncbi:MAG: transposase [Aquisalimonadaceae bacterium]
MNYRRYDEQFKVEAVELALQPDVQTQVVAAKLGACFPAPPGRSSP